MIITRIGSNGPSAARVKAFLWDLTLIGACVQRGRVFVHLIMTCRLANGHWHRLPGSGAASLSMQPMHCITSCNLACIVPGKVVNYMGFLLEINRRLQPHSGQMHFFLSLFSSSFFFFSPSKRNFLASGAQKRIIWSQNSRLLRAKYSEI